MERIDNHKLGFIFVLAIMLPYIRAAAAPGRAVTGQPKLVYSWWRKNQRPAGAIGFASNSSAIILLHTGPAVAGVISGPPLDRFDRIVKSEMGMIGGRVSHIPHLTADEDSELSRVEQPGRLVLPRGWTIAGGIHAGSAVAANGRVLAVAVRSGDGAGAVCLWGLVKHNVISILPNPSGTSEVLPAFSPHGRSIAIGYSPARSLGYIYIRDVRSGALEQKLRAPSGRPGWRAMAMVYLGSHRLAVLGTDRRLWIARLTGRKPALQPAPKSSVRLQANWSIGPPDAMCYIPSENQIVFTMCGLGRPSIYVCNARTGMLLRRVLLRPQQPPSTVIGLTPGANPRQVIVAINVFEPDLPGYFAAVDISTGKLSWRSHRISGGCTSIAVSPDGKAAITGGELGTRLWRLPSDR